MKKRRKRSGGTGMLSVAVIVLIFLGVMGVQIIRLQKQEENYRKTLLERESQLQMENERAEEITQLERYMKSLQYVEDVAKNKLGLVYDNEIIYKERK